MRVHVVDRSQQLPGPPAAVISFFSDAFNLERIPPPWLGFRVLTPGPVAMACGTEIEHRLRLHGMPIRWLTRIEVWDPPLRFVDVQIRGPHRLWEHTHTFAPDDERTLMRDTVRYARPARPARRARAAGVRRS